MSQAEAERFSALYRQGTTELARVKAFSPNRRLAESLEQAVATAHFAMHKGPRTRVTDALLGFLFEVPRLVRKNWRYMLVSAILTFLPAAIAFVAVSRTPESYYLFVDPDLAAGRDPWASREFLERSLEGGAEDLESGAFFSSMLFVHNTRVSFMCFSWGILLGLPTIYMLCLNGLMLGAFLAVYFQAGLGVEVLAWLLPHGVPEIGAIVLCGGCGLMLGHRLLNPGEMARKVALPLAAGEACVIGLGCVPLLAAAGLIEGIFRESQATLWQRYAMFAVMAALVGGWLLFARRPQSDEKAPAEKS